MKILTKQIDEYRSDLSDKIVPEFIIYLINDLGDRIKAKMCLGESSKQEIVTDFIASIVMNDKLNGIESKIEFEDISFQDFKNTMN